MWLYYYVIKKNLKPLKRNTSLWLPGFEGRSMRLKALPRGTPGQTDCSSRWPRARPYQASRLSSPLGLPWLSLFWLQLWRPCPSLEMAPSSARSDAHAGQLPCTSALLSLAPAVAPAPGLRPHGNVPQCARVLTLRTLPAPPHSARLPLVHRRTTQCFVSLIVLGPNFSGNVEKRPKKRKRGVKRKICIFKP